MKRVTIESKIQANLILAVIFNSNKFLGRINLSADTEILQTSVIEIKKETPISAHKHNLIKRETYGTQEVWIIIKGRAIVGFYDLDDSFLCFKKVVKGDLILNFRSGHSIESVSPKLTFIEIKNGPYLGGDYDKVSIIS